MTWTLALSEEYLFIKSNGEIQKKYGVITGMQICKDKPDGIKIRFLNVERPKTLPLSFFGMEDNNEISSEFASCITNRDTSEFMRIWNHSIKPFLDQTSGKFIRSNKHGPNLKRTVTSTPPLPKRPKMSEVSEEEMDKHIQDHFIGFFTLPVSTLFEPPPNLLIRESADEFILCLKREMIENPTVDVQPILCSVKLDSGQKFDPNFKDAYQYYTIGGNNSRVALQQLLKEKPYFSEDKNYTHRLCSVYSPMPTHLSLRLASKHNRATSFSHSMSTWDKVIQCRKLIFDLSGDAYEEEKNPPKRPPKWKNVCACTLSMKVDQLDDAMIYYLAALPKDIFSI